MDQLKHHVAYLADDKLEGREAGRRGGRAAGDYLKTWLEEYGLAGAGVDGGFLQPFAPNFRNVLARLEGSDPELKKQLVLVGAHYDHVGFGTRRNSRGPIGYVHNGADDNASGTSALLELAEAFTMLPGPPKRSILFAFWDAEEKGLLGSKHWIAHPTLPIENVVAVLNMDMVGRLREDQLNVFGSRTAYGWRRLVSRQNEGIELLLEFSWDVKPAADHYPFFRRNLPVLMLHTNEHEEYHTPRDDAKLINHVGMSRVARLVFGVVYDLAAESERLRFREAAARETERTRKALTARITRPADRLGVSWQPGSPFRGGLSQTPSDGRSAEGLRLTRVVAGSPAAKAGLHPGDRVFRCAGQEIQSGDDLRAAVMSAESPVLVAVRRSGQEKPLELTVELAGKPLRLGITWRVDDAEPGTIILTHVVPGSPAARAGLRRGDRIYQVAGRDFPDDVHFAKLTKTLPDPLELLVERNGRLHTVVIHVKTKPLKRAA